MKTNPEPITKVKEANIFESYYITVATLKVIHIYMYYGNTIGKYTGTVDESNVFYRLMRPVCRTTCLTLLM